MPGKIKVVVKDQKGRIYMFKVKPTTLFKKLRNAFADATGVAKDQITLAFEGNNVDLDESLQSMGVSSIYVMQFQPEVAFNHSICKIVEFRSAFESQVEDGSRIDSLLSATGG